MEIRILNDGLEHWPAPTWPLRPVCKPSESPPVQYSCSFSGRRASVTCPECIKITNGYPDSSAPDA